MEDDIALITKRVQKLMMEDKFSGMTMPFLNITAHINYTDSKMKIKEEKKENKKNMYKDFCLSHCISSHLLRLCLSPLMLPTLSLSIYRLLTSRPEF